MEEDEDISYVVPKEGALLWQDCLCIPTGAPHPDNAHTFINFILDAEVGAAIADFINYATANKAAKALLSENYTQNPAIFPSDETIALCEAAIYLGEEGQRLRDETWTRILAA
jgi:spermidine/putrescine transport system substrate-binding protein